MDCLCWQFLSCIGLTNNCKSFNAYILQKLGNNKEIPQSNVIVYLKYREEEDTTKNIQSHNI